MAGALIGALRVSLSAETSAFEAGMKRAQRTASTAAKTIKGEFSKAFGAANLLKAGVAGFVSAISIGSIVAASKAALEYAGSLGETAQALGVTTKELQTFRFAAQQNGATMEEADKSLGKLALSISKARSGSKEAAAAFASVGVSLADLDSKSKSEILGKIADGMKAAGGASNNAAAGVAIFGKGFQKIVPVLDQGSAGINELSLAAEKLGIVLSDDQIAKADQTADKLDALKTVLSARIAGIVADNADSILGLANALSDLVGVIGSVINAWKQMEASFNAKVFDFFGDGPAAARARGSNFQSDRNPSIPGRSVTIPLGPARRPAPTSAPTGSPNKFLASGGGKPKKTKQDHSAENALRDAAQFDQEIRRAQIDVLNATKDLATDAVERYAISVQIKDAEKAAFEADLQYQQQLYKLTDGQQGLSEVQAQQLKVEHDKLDQLQRDALIAEENERARKASAEVDMNQLEMERDLLQSQAQLAETAKEQREVQLKILDNAYKIARAQLEEIIASRDATEAQKEIARQRLQQLNRTYGNDRQGVINGTRGPLEDLFSQLPNDAKKLNEALESVAANGLKSIEDGLVDVLMGTKSLKQAFHQMAAEMLADLLRIAIQKYVIGSIMKAIGITGGFADGGQVPGFAYGGFVSGPGGPRQDRVPAMLSAGEFVVNAKATRAFLPLLKRINEGGVGHYAAGGLFIPRASYGSRAGISNDNAAGMPAMRFEFHNDFRGADPASVAAIKARQDQFEAELPGRVVRTMNDARDRFVWRDKR